MNIAIIVPGFSAYPNHWAIPALQTLATQLAKKNKLTVFSQRYPPQGVYRFNNLIHYAIGSGERRGVYSPVVWLNTVKQVLAVHKKTPFDVLHAFWADEAGLSAILAGALIKRPVVVSIAGWELINIRQVNYGAQQFLFKQIVIKHVLNTAQAITAGSMYQVNLCQRHGVLDKKLFFAPLGVDAQLFKPSKSIDWQTIPPTIVQAASLIPVKNQALLFEVIKLVKEKLPNIKLNLAGSGPLYNSLINLGNKLDINNNIVWHKQCPYPQMPHFYQQGHLYLQTSWHEAQGMSVLEGMACGLPVIGTPVGVVKRVACLPPQHSAEALAKQVINIFDDETAYKNLRLQARREIESTFSVQQTVNNFCEIYKQLGNAH